jgi:hypothetical protein
MKTALITALAAIGVLTAACSSHGAAAPHATVTVTATAIATHSAPAQSGQAVTAATPSAPPATAPPNVPPPSGQAPAVPVPAPCLTRYLGGTVGLSQGTPGSTYVVLDLKNLNNHPCTLYGYPGVSLGGGVPVSQIGLAAAESPATPRELVTLGAHKTASALLQIVHAGNYPPPACHPVTAHWLIIYPPNQTVPVYLGYNSPTCAKKIQILTISAMRPGTGG